MFDEGELDPGPTIRKSRIVQTEGDREVARDVELYNLDVIISVGYRVKSHRGTQFRLWATQRLREYLVKGFALDDERLKEIRTLPGGRDYALPPADAARRRRFPVFDGVEERRSVGHCLDGGGRVSAVTARIAERLIETSAPNV